MSKTKILTPPAELFYAALRNDFTTFIEKTFEVLNPGQTYSRNWHIETIAHHLEQCAAGKIKRLIINLPPRHLKSIITSVAFPAWLLGRDPTMRIICVSYAQELARKHGLDCHQVVESEFYQKVFPGMHLSEKPNTDQEFATTKNGFRLATSVGGTITGRGGNLVIVDDPLKPIDAFSDPERERVNDWYSNTLLSRLDNKVDGVIIIVMQRLHLDDLVGHVKGLADWTILSIPAIAELEETYRLNDKETYTRKPGELIDPKREPQSAVDELKRGLMPQMFAAQYQQNPVPLGDQLIRWEWFKWYDTPPASFDFISQCWDTASKAEEIHDYSVCTTWGVLGQTYYLLDLARIRLDYPDLREYAAKLAIRWKADHVLFENAGIGPALRADLESRRIARINIQDPKEGKILRVVEQSAKLAEGRVRLPRKAPWLKDFHDETVAFPQARHDDQVDSMEAFLRNVDHIRRDLAFSTRRDLQKRDANGAYPGEPQVTVHLVGAEGPRRLFRYF